jgi:hypothetical protein
MSRLTKLFLCSLALMVATSWFGRDVWLGAMGRYLTATPGAAVSSADFAVIPAADYIRADVDMDTLKQTMLLLQTGRVKRIVMSCPDFYGISECDLAEAALRRGGFPGDRIERLRTDRLPDEVEAGTVIRWLANHGARSAIVFLPNYKARRLGHAYRRFGSQSGVEVTTSSQSREFDPQRWWKSREGQKRLVEELARLTRLV